MIETQLTTLKSGMQTLFVPIDYCRSITVLILVRAGSRYENSNQFGLAHFLEHMLFKGSKSYPSAQLLARTVDGIGADFNAFTSREYTGFYIRAESSKLDLSVKVLGSMLFESNLRLKDIMVERGVILEEMNMYADNPASEVDKQFDWLVYLDQGLAHPILGDPQQVAGFTKKDFLTFLRQWYVPQNMLLVLAGDKRVLSDCQLISRLESTIAGLVNHQSQISLSDMRHCFNLPRKNWSEFNSDQCFVVAPNRRCKLIKKDTNQAHFVLGWPALHRYHHDRYAMELMSIILGGNMSSRLFSEVREKQGLCYYVHSSLDSFSDCGMLTVAAGVDLKRTEQAITAVLREIHWLKEGVKRFTRFELDSAKQFWIGKLRIGLEDSYSVAQYYGMRQLLHQAIVSPEEMIAQVNKVSLSQLERLVSQLLLGSQASLAIIGPFDDQQPFIDILNSFN